MLVKIIIINKYQMYFDFIKYGLIPNSYVKLLNITELINYNDIPEEIINGIKIIYFVNLK